MRGPGEAVARAAGANCGRRSRDETVAREKRERARYDRRKRKGDIDEWNRESGVWDREKIFKI